MSGIPIEIIKEMFPSLSLERIREVSKQHPDANWNTLFDFYEQENRIKSEEGESIKTRTGDSPEPVDSRKDEIKSHQDIDYRSPSRPNSDSEKEKRRDPHKISYSPIPCTNVFVNGEWGNPDNCSETCKFSHTHYEIVHHPSKVDNSLENPRNTLEKREALLIEEINELKFLNNCYSCRTEEYVFICKNCYHTLCYLCRHKSDVCFVCKTEAKFIQRPNN